MLVILVVKRSTKKATPKTAKAPKYDASTYGELFGEVLKRNIE